MKIPNTRRCCQCRRLFVPNPRVGDRQVTCGDPRCQRERHAERCRQWHKHNPGASSEHYRDAVEPFRGRQPSYQRRWRLGRSLREIREQTAELVGSIGARLRALIVRGHALSNVATETQQTGVIAGQSLSDTLAMAAAIAAALEDVTGPLAQLGALGI